MFTSCWILLDIRKSGNLSNMELHWFWKPSDQCIMNQFSTIQMVNGPLLLRSRFFPVVTTSCATALVVIAAGVVASQLVAIAVGEYLKIF